MDSHNHRQEQCTSEPNSATIASRKEWRGMLHKGYVGLSVPQTGSEYKWMHVTQRKRIQTNANKTRISHRLCSTLKTLLHFALEKHPIVPMFQILSHHDPDHERLKFEGPLGVSASFRNRLFYLVLRKETPETNSCILFWHIQFLESTEWNSHVHENRTNKTLSPGHWTKETALGHQKDSTANGRATDIKHRRKLFFVSPKSVCSFNGHNFTIWRKLDLGFLIQ